MSPMNVDTIAKQLLFSTVHITAESDAGLSTGTGFVYDVSRQSGRVVPALITNKHVIEGAKRLKVRMVGLDNGSDTPDLIEPVEILFNDLDSWVGHPREDVDVTAMFLGPVLRQAEEAGKPAFIRQPGAEQYPTPELLEYLDAVEDVLFIGYPNGLYDRVNNTPIVRRGITATPVHLNWNGNPSFLIDASVFPGSSGSPVFLVQTGQYRTAQGVQLGGPPRVVLLGIVAAVMLQPDTGEIVTRQTSRAVEFSQMIDLGIVYNWLAIDQAVDALCMKFGIDRANVAAPVPPQAPQRPASKVQPGEKLD